MLFPPDVNVFGGTAADITGRHISSDRLGVSELWRTEATAAARIDLQSVPSVHGHHFVVDANWRLVGSHQQRLRRCARQSAKQAPGRCVTPILRHRNLAGRQGAKYFFDTGAPAKLSCAARV